MDRSDRERILSDLPTEILSQCKDMAEEIRTHNNSARDSKILAARIRMCSGFYDSERVINKIASRLLRDLTRDITSS